VSESNKKQRTFRGAKIHSARREAADFFFAAESMSRVVNRAMLLRLLRSEDLTRAHSMCGFADELFERKKTAMLTLSLSIDSVAASDDRIRTRPWLLMRMSLGPSAPAGMPETEIERAD
jgi:hypothetical protein